jgi:glycosyltransferase involved in cell wall biosynthesis
VNVTFGVCAKNAEKTIEECLNSIVNQSYPKKLMRIIVVDGFSRDKTVPVAANAVKGTGVQMEIHSDNERGLGAARQIATDKAIGKYIIFVDADVILFPNVAEEHVKLMEENPGVGVAFGKSVYKEGKLLSKVQDLNDLALGGIVAFNATIIRLKSLRQINGFDVKIKGATEDRDLIVRIKADGWLVLVNEKAKFFHKTRETLRELWNEREWFGYGDHYFNHKYPNIDHAWRKLPLRSFFFGMKISLRAYNLTHQRISFLIPFHTTFSNLAWWLGFLKAHIDCYGH